MASSIPTISSPIQYHPSKTLPSISQFTVFLRPVCFSNSFRRLQSLCCTAAKQQSGTSVKTNSKKRKKKSSSNGGVSKEFSLEDVGLDEEERESGRKDGRKSQGFVPLPLPKPPAGFVVDEQGRVVMAASQRIVSIVDPTNKLSLECIVRRVFRSSRGVECMLLCPVDTPVQILKSTNINGWAAQLPVGPEWLWQYVGAPLHFKGLGRKTSWEKLNHEQGYDVHSCVGDEEVEAILPTAAYALAKIHMHLVHSGFCFTARGGFCYSEDSIFEFRSDDGQDVDGVPSEGLEITCFHLDGSHYMIYTQSDPLLFVAMKDQNGVLQIADDELLDDPAVISAIDEETEFNALVEEEAALLESVLGER